MVTFFNPKEPPKKFFHSRKFSPIRTQDAFENFQLVGLLLLLLIKIRNKNLFTTYLHCPTLWWHFGFGYRRFFAHYFWVFNLININSWKNCKILNLTMWCEDRKCTAIILQVCVLSDCTVETKYESQSQEILGKILRLLGKTNRNWKILIEKVCMHIYSW